MKRFVLRCGVAVAVCASLCVAAQHLPKRVADYSQNFDAIQAGAALPDDVMVLDGGFSVKEEEGKKFLELPGDPLETFGVLMGPSQKGTLVVGAKVFGTAKGRRAPTLGIGAMGAGGFKLLLAGSKKSIELYQGETLLQSVPTELKMGQWTQLLLSVSGEGKETKVEGKAWIATEAEPAGWMLTAQAVREPSAGKCSFWGSPYSGTPIRFDDLQVWSVK